MILATIGVMLTAGSVFAVTAQVPDYVLRMALGTPEILLWCFSSFRDMLVFEDINK